MKLAGMDIEEPCAWCGKVQSIYAQGVKSAARDVNLTFWEGCKQEGNWSHHESLFFCNDKCRTNYFTEP